METSFVSFTTNNNYCQLSEIMIKSLNVFSKHKIILYCVDFDKPNYYDKYDNLICKRIDWKNKFNIYYLKPLIILDAITNMGVEKGIYIESDDIATKNIDNLFKECERITHYPLCPIHPRDPNNQCHVMRRLRIKNKTMPYVHAHVVFTNKTKSFIEEWYATCIDFGNGVRANWDETVLNTLFWKHNINDYINYFYDPYYVNFFNKEWMEDEEKINKTYMFHGCKDLKKAQEILEKMEKN